MNINCPRCGKVLAVPPEKAHMTGINARCSGCGAVFLMDVAPLADSAPEPRGGPSPAAAASPAPVTAASPSPAPDAAGRPSEKPHPPVPWRRCTNHPQERSENVCGACGKGWCKACGKASGSAVLCPACEGACVSFQKREEGEARARSRAVHLFEEIETIGRYPLTDPVAFAVLSIAVAVIDVLAVFSGYAFLVSRALVMAYATMALMRASRGDLQGFLPEIKDARDLVEPLSLGLAVFLASSWPTILVAVLWPDARLLGPPPEGAEPTGAGVATLLALSYLWRLLYTPVALIVAGVSRSVAQTLNPAVGYETLLRMGPVCAQAMAVYGGLTLAQMILGFPLFFLPIVGGVLSGVVDTYAALCVGCALGLAVFKRAPELQLE